MVIYAITLKDSNQLIGAISLINLIEKDEGELGYWLGVPFWGQGYCTEAALALVNYGFNRLQLKRIYCHHLSRNPASGRVMQKLGMRHYKATKEKLKDDKLENVEHYELKASNI